MTNPTASVLLIDDDEALTQLLAEFLGQFGLASHAAATPEEGLRLLQKPFSVVELAREVRKALDG